MPGSARAGSFNRQLAGVAAGLLGAAGAEVTLVDLRELSLPVFDADIEARGMPAGAIELRRLFAQADALVIATPEYNGFVPPLLTNSFDWLSRVPASEGLPSGLESTAGKVAGVMSASPGALGGLRGMNYLRQFLQMAIGMLVVPQQFALNQAHKAFDASGQLIDTKQQESVQRVTQAVLRTAGALRASAA
jgi:chromate reductase, NAD(P)H dehydrogenase (quinone)